MLDEEGFIKLKDFTLASMFEPNGKPTKEVLGTAEYMAPEILSRKGYNFQVDWWALGVVLYELLIGINPFFNKERA